jgi:hypothetical protein
MSLQKDDKITGGERYMQQWDIFVTFSSIATFNILADILRLSSLSTTTDSGSVEVADSLRHTGLTDHTNALFNSHD